MKEIVRIPAEVEAGAEEARRDIAAGHLRLHYGARSAWGEDLREKLRARLGVELVQLSCFVTDESRSFVAGYNETVIAHLDGIFGPDTVAGIHEEVQLRRKERYDAMFAVKRPDR